MMTTSIKGHLTLQMSLLLLNLTYFPYRGDAKFISGVYEIHDSCNSRCPLKVSYDSKVGTNQHVFTV